MRPAGASVLVSLFGVVRLWDFEPRHSFGERRVERVIDWRESKIRSVV